MNRCVYASSPCPDKKGGPLTCIYCYLNHRGKGNYRNHRYYLHPSAHRNHYGSSSMKRPVETDNVVTSPNSLKDDRFCKKYPLLLEHLADTVWEDGTSRETSTVSLFIEQGSFKAALNDRALKRSVYVTGESLDAVLGALEIGLSKGTHDWRIWGKNTKKK